MNSVVGISPPPPGEAGTPGAPARAGGPLNPPPRTDLATMYGIEGLLAGRTLMDRYLVQEVIGRGGMGAVYRARDARLGREVAVKVVSVAVSDAEAHARLRARFQREARAAAQLHHPNVVSVFDFGTDPALGLDFLVMELLRGEDLANRLARKGPPALPTAIRILHQAALGLEAGHRAGLIHRDVKPGNLFLEPGDRVGEVRVKVLDFGIADIAASEDATVTHLTVVGRSPFSPAFASPEQLRGDARLTPASDVFSLGAVGYQLLTGQRVFTAADWRQALAEVAAALAALPQRVPKLPSALRDALRRALAAEPRDRFADAGALADALAPLLSDREAAAAPRGPATGGRDDASLPDHTVLVEPRGPAEQTRVLTDIRAPDPRAADPRLQPGAVPARFADPQRRVSPELQSVLQRQAAMRAAGAPAPAAPRPGWLRRTTRALWNFTLTAGAVGLFGLCWFGVATAVDGGDLTVLYAAAAASVVATPLAVHRLLRSRGSLRLALFASVLGSIASVYFLARNGSVESVLATMFVAQTVLSFGAERLTRGRGAPRGDPEQG